MLNAGLCPFRLVKGDAGRDYLLCWAILGIGEQHKETIRSNRTEMTAAVWVLLSLLLTETFSLEFNMFR